MRKVTIHSNKDLEGKLWLPSGANRGIVVAHSFRNDSGEPVCSEASEYFANKGYAVLALDFLGHGKSKGELRDVSYRTTSENITSAIQYLKEQGISRVGVYAISIGAIATVLSKEQPDAQVFVSPSPVYNPRGLLERYSEYINSQREQLEEKGYATITSGSGRGNFQMGKEWINEMESENGETRTRHIQNKVPTLIIQGTEDELTRVNDAKKFVKDTGNDHLYIPKGDHNLTNVKHREIAIEEAERYFDRKL